MKQYRMVFLVCLLSLGLKAQVRIDTLRISNYLSTVEDKGQCMGSLSIMQGGKTIYAHRLGKDLLAEDREIARPLYRVGSISKIFTAVLIIQQVEKGRLKLDTRLSEYFPEVPRAADITISQLLGHTAGLGNYLMQNDTSYTWVLSKVTDEDILKEIIRQGILYEPGKGVKYSNSSTYLLANILVKIAGKPYTEIVKESIFGPLQLQNTYTGLVEHPDLVTPCRKNEEGAWVEVPDLYFPNVMGVGELAATPEDINRFLHALFSGKLVSAEHVREVMKPYGTDRFGRGLMYFSYAGHTFYGHTGETFGVRSIGLYNEQDDLAITVSLNGFSFQFPDFVEGLCNAVYGAE